MRLALLGLLLLGLGLQDQEPPRHDKYRDDPKAYCFHGKPDTSMPGNPSAHPCECSFMCATDPTGHRGQAEQTTCELWCTVARCLCHTEEICDLPEVKP